MYAICFAEAQAASGYGLSGMIGSNPVGLMGNLQRPNAAALGTLGSGVVGASGAFPGVAAMQMNSKLPNKAVAVKPVQGRMQAELHGHALGQNAGHAAGQHRGRLNEQPTESGWTDSNGMAGQPGAAMRKIHGLDVSKLVDMEQVSCQLRKEMS